MYISLAGSWNIISGFVGYVSLGHAVFFGVGAYLAALQITNFGTHWLPASLLAGVGTSLLAVPVGALCLRLRGPFFAIFMLGLNELMAIVASVYDNITGGAEGLSLPILRQIIPLYFAMGLTALSVFLVMRWLESSRFGLRLLSIREDETAADTLGTNTTLYKLIAFIMSAFFPGVVGGIYAPLHHVYRPRDGVQHPLQRPDGAHVHPGREGDGVGSRYRGDGALSHSGIHLGEFPPLPQAGVGDPDRPDHSLRASRDHGLYLREGARAVAALIQELTPHRISLRPRGD